METESGSRLGGLTRLAPGAAVGSVLAAMACCLPIAIPAGSAAAVLGLALEPLRGWMMGLSVLLVGLGVIQLRRDRRACRPPSPVRIGMLVASAILVGTAILFPQVLAGLIADWFPGGSR